MNYPDWLPRPKAWLQAIVLLFSLIPIVLIMRLTLVPFILVSRPFDSRDYWGVAWLIITGVCIPIFLLAHIYQLLWGEANPKFPKGIPSLRSWGEGVYSWTAIIVCLLIGASYVVTTRDLTTYPTTYSTTYRVFEEQLRREAQALGCVFVIVAAYLYHLKYLIAKRFDPNRFRPTKRKP